jgi:hypothetical protein
MVQILNTAGFTDASVNKVYRTIQHQTGSGTVTDVIDDAAVDSGSGSFGFGDKMLTGDITYQVTVTDNTDTDSQDVYVPKPEYGRNRHVFGGKGDGADGRTKIQIDIDKTQSAPKDKHKVKKLA